MVRQWFGEHDLAWFRAALLTRRHHPFRFGTAVGGDDAAVAEDAQHTARRVGDAPHRAAFVAARARGPEACQHALTRGKRGVTARFGYHEHRRRRAVRGVPVCRPRDGVAVGVGAGDHHDSRARKASLVGSLPSRERVGETGSCHISPVASLSCHAPRPSSSTPPWRFSSSRGAWPSRCAVWPRPFSCAARVSWGQPQPQALPPRHRGLAVRRAPRTQWLALLRQQCHRLVQRDLLHHHAARQVGDRLAVLHIGAEPALAHRDQLLVRRVRPERAHARHLASRSDPPPG